MNRPAVDTSYFKPKNMDTDNSRLRLSIIGRLHWVKGIDFALIGIKSLKNYNKISIINIVGVGDELEKLRFMTHDLAIENKVHFHGLLKDIKLRKMYNNSDIILLPSLSEGISNTAIESMSMGRFLFLQIVEACLN